MLSILRRKILIIQCDECNFSVGMFQKTLLSHRIHWFCEDTLRMYEYMYKTKGIIIRFTGEISSYFYVQLKWKCPKLFTGMGVIQRTFAFTLFERRHTIAAYFISGFYCAGYSHISEVVFKNPYMAFFKWCNIISKEKSVLFYWHTKRYRVDEH